MTVDHPTLQALAGANSTDEQLDVSSLLMVGLTTGLPSGPQALLTTGLPSGPQAL